MERKKKDWDRIRLSIIITVCGMAVLFLTYLITGIIAPSAVDYSGAAVSYTEEDYDVSSEGAAEILLSDEEISVSDTGVQVSGTNVRITKPGTYRLKGTLSDGCIYVSASTGGIVHLILSDAEITCTQSPPVYISSADKVVITLADGTENALNAVLKGGLESAVYSDCDLTFNGTGSLSVCSANGIAVNCSNNVRFAGGTYEITAEENAIKAKYSVSVQDGILNLHSGADGIRTTATGKSGGKWVGTVSIQNGTLNIESDGDAINAGSVIRMDQGTVRIESGGGSVDQETSGGFGMGRPDEQNTAKSTESAKGLKAETGVCISGGDLTIDSADDAVHSDGNVTVTGGTLHLSASDDGIHGDDSVMISGGTIDISRSYEGIEGHYIVIDDGEISVTASDDGMNASSGKNPIALLAKMMETELFETGGRLIIRGGTVDVISSGDGLDSNGSIIQTGGTVTVNCKSNGADGALDFDGSYRMSGGTLAAFGNGGMMLQTITESKSSVNCIVVGGDISEGSIVSVRNEEGDELFSARSAASASSAVLASEEFAQGMTVTALIDSLEIGSAEISDESVQIGTVSANDGHPGGPDGQGSPDGEGMNDRNMGAPWARWIPVSVAAAVLVLTAVILQWIRRKRNKRKQTDGEARQ